MSSANVSRRLVYDVHLVCLDRSEDDRRRLDSIVDLPARCDRPGQFHPLDLRSGSIGDLLRKDRCMSSR